MSNFNFHRCPVDGCNEITILSHLFVARLSISVVTQSVTYWIFLHEQYTCAFASISSSKTNLHW